MKAKLILIATILNGIVFACNDHLYHLALNQRSFYNPAALCPYCKGSAFLSTGFSFFPGSNSGIGNFYSFGNDGENAVHGPWDISYAAMRSPEMRTDAYSFRYAYGEQIGNWKVGIGFRESYYSIHENVSTEGMSSQKYSAKMFDTDFGVMLTNQKGIYVGMSVLHAGSPQKSLTNENGTQYIIGMTPSFTVMGGYVQRISKKWDVLPDVSLMKNKTETAGESGAMIRYKHHYAFGGEATFSTDENASFDLRAGYMSSKFKWLFSAGPSTQGWNVETGIVWRFWFIGGPCDGKGGGGGTCTAGGSGSFKPRPHVKKEKVTDNDDFSRHR